MDHWSSCGLISWVCSNSSKYLTELMRWAFFLHRLTFYLNVMQTSWNVWQTEKSQRLLTSLPPAASWDLGAELLSEISFQSTFKKNVRGKYLLLWDFLEGGCLLGLQLFTFRHLRARWMFEDRAGDEFLHFWILQRQIQRLVLLPDVRSKYCTDRMFIRLQHHLDNIQLANWHFWSTRHQWVIYL